MSRAVERFSSCRWEIGDLWLGRPPDTDTESTADRLGLSVAMLYNYGWMARAFSVSRRRPLSYSHHCAVAALPLAIADDLLDKAVAGRWSVARIREAAREAAREQAIEAERAAQQTEFNLTADAVSWRTDARRVERECRERLIAVEAKLRSIIDDVAALAEHPGGEVVHGNRRKATAAKLRSLLAPGGTGVDLTPYIQPLLERIWTDPAVARLKPEKRTP